MTLRSKQKLADRRDAGRATARPSTMADRAFAEKSQPNQGNHTVLRGVRNVIQPKLKIGRPNDRNEREAEQVAQAVVCKSNHTRLPSIGGPNCTATIHPLIGAPSASAPSPKEVVPKSVGDILASGQGRPLESSTRNFMESRFGGQDFSQVRVHTDTKAARAARAIGAEAYAAGRDIVFSEGAYSPHTIQGQQLLAHELTHVIQQDKGGSSSTNHATVQRQEVTGPTIRAPSTEELYAEKEQNRTFEMQILRIVALGPMLKIEFRIRHPLNKWQDYHFFGAGPGAGVEIPLLDRPSAVETHKTQHEMRITDFRGRGRVLILGVPRTNIKFMWFTFTEGPEEVGFVPVSWKVETGVRQPYAIGWYFGRFDFGHGLHA